MCLLVDRNRIVLNPCAVKGEEGSCTNLGDRLLSGLPNELVLLILSFLTTKEVRRTSVISKRWRRWLLGYYPKLNFEDSRSFVEIWTEFRKNEEKIAKERSKFVKRVDNVIKQHLDSSIDEFRVAFDLHSTYQSHIDSWLQFALRKRVKTLELDFQPVFLRSDISDYSELNRCGLTIHPFTLLDINHSLASLSLIYANITSEVIECIFRSCPFLEKLCIDESEVLTSIESHASSVSLKHLDVSNCNKLQMIDISAPKLVFLKYIGQPIELNIRNASSLSSLFIGGRTGEEIAYAFEAMPSYFPQLEVLYLQISLGVILSEYNIGIEHLQLQQFTRLKVLELYIGGSHSLSLLGWAPLIEACPILEKLTIKFDCHDNGVDDLLTKRSGSPLKSLKTLEISGYCGRRLDIEFITFIIENAINLQHITVEVENTPYKVKPDQPFRINVLKEIVPSGINFVLI